MKSRGSFAPLLLFFLSTMGWGSPKAPPPSQVLLEHALIQLTDADPMLRDQAVAELERLNDLQSLPPLITALRDADVAVRRRVISVIHGFGDRASAPLVEAFARPTERSRPAIALLLGRLGARHLPLLTQGLDDPDQYVRVHCVLALGETQHPHALTSLALALTHRDGSVRTYVPTALAKLGPLGFPMLEQAVSHPDAMVRYHATGLLGAMKQPEALPSLVKALQDPDMYVKEMAMQGLCALGPSAAPSMLIALTDVNPMNRSLAMEKIVEYRATALLPQLIKLLESPVTNDRSAAVTVLGGFASPLALTALLPLLHDPVPVIRRHVARSLGAFGLAGLPGLTTAWHDADATVRRQALNALVQLSLPDFKRFLAEGTRDADSSIRRDIPLFVLLLPRENTERLTEYVRLVAPLLKDPDPTVRTNVIRCLGQLQCPEAVTALREAARDSNAIVRQAAQQALGWFGELDSDLFAPKGP